jgi:hypothetical protein
MLVDEDERKPYERLQESEGPLNQITIKTGDNELVDLGERSLIVRAIETFKLYRVYMSDGDDQARRFLEKVIKQEVKNGTRGESKEQHQKGG